MSAATIQAHNPLPGTGVDSYLVFLRSAHLEFDLLDPAGTTHTCDCEGKAHKAGSL